MQQPRLILHAALENIRQRKNVEENIGDVVEVLSHSAELSDTLLYFQDRRPNADFSGELSYEDLSNVGKYTTHRWQFFGLKGISFRKDSILDFIFKKRAPTTQEIGDDLIRLVQTNTPEEDIDRALIAGALGRDPREGVLANSRSLKYYSLHCVTLSRMHMIPWIIRPKETIYSSL